MYRALICISFLCISLFSLVNTGCSAKKQGAVYGAGEKAKVGPLVYSVTDTEVRQQLGDDPDTARTPQNRFFLVRVAVSNSGSDDEAIPSMTLVDDAGQSYGELADGSNVPNWLGVVRKVGPTQTEQGVVVFDAPSKHYRLRLNDPLDEKEIAIDVPLNFVHEEKRNLDDTPFQAPAEIKVPKK
jgi:hypothetical protein